MMINNKPKQPFPDPDNFQDIRAWAKEVTQHFQRDSVTGMLQKDPLLLQHQVDSQLSRATVDGVLMLDPTNQAVVVSAGGVWKAIISGNIAAIEGGATNATAGTVDVVFNTPFASIPAVIATPEMVADGNTTYSVNIDTISETGFTATFRIIDTAYGTQVRADSGNFSWLAFLTI